MALAIDVLSKLNSFPDYARAEEEFQAKKQAAGMDMLVKKAQIQELQRKSQEVDLDKLGETAFMKASQGMPLNPQETAALQWVDAKQQTFGFNPVTGAMEQKPSLLARAGVNTQMPHPMAGPMNNAPMGNPTANQPPRLPPVNQPSEPPPMLPPLLNPAPEQGAFVPGSRPQAVGNPVTNTPQQLTPQQELEAEFNKEYNSLEGNPKAQQELKVAYLKSKFTPTEDQSKAAGFSDRMMQSNQIVSEKSKAGADPMQRVLSSIPLLGNFVTSDDFQSFNQAQRDFINAQLRRESGAAISEGEFANARQQYFPQPGDSDQVLAQKEKNRQTAIRGMQRSAGPSYKAQELYDKSKAKFDASKSNAIPYTDYFK